MRERREGRVGTVSGLALLAGGTAMAASVGGDHQSLSATLLLGALTLGLGHSLLDEIKRQARRAAARWSRSDTTNAVLLGVWAETSLLASILLFHSSATRAVGLVLAVAYAAACGYFVTERRRTVAETTPAVAAPGRQPTVKPDEEPGEEPGAGHLPTTVDLGVISPPSPTAAVTTAGDEPRRPEDDGTVLHQRHGGFSGHAPTAGHGPMMSARRPSAGPAPALPTHPMSHGPAKHGRSVAHAPAAHIFAGSEAAGATNAA
ncbi:hypothetical protein JIG36_14925 [Actinoplanes sp. LDG1-06]|uniref:Uncharacterized protein n=1 Tax=Paractinoplanes ovalisporus TaxID=2810368 RepID=A0ABS2AAJ1_9ACTN|nr:hypothetical protein [Actinoplanes ovalisporus]MBM2616852.1 hypothetical protein [Actinoplanes ovalisporus]